MTPEKLGNKNPERDIHGSPQENRQDLLEKLGVSGGGGGRGGGTGEGERRTP